MAASLSSPDELWSVLQPDMIQETIGFDGVRNTDDLFPIEITLTRLAGRMAQQSC